MIAEKGQNTREISTEDRAAALGEAKTGGFLGLHAMSGTDMVILVIFPPYPRKPGSNHFGIG